MTQSLAERMAEIQALYEKATKGPWKITTLFGTDILQPMTGPNRIARLYRDRVNPRHDIDSAFIVALVNAWPQLREMARDCERYRWLLRQQGRVWKGIAVAIDKENAVEADYRRSQDAASKEQSRVD